VDSTQRGGGAFELEWDVPPAAPRLTRVTAGDRSVAVTWSPPAATPGTPRMGYLVLAEPENPAAGFVEPLYLPVTSGAATVRGLRNGVGYRVSVAAVNGSGPGTFATSARVVPAVPR
jgi:hypothetical protein